jgi:predicted 3-demethylubiquinone-9 3-methyltransferase (glyoxalase superfamily)
MSGVIPFLWFDTQAEEAAHFYSATFPGAKLGEIRRFPAGNPHGTEGSVMTASFDLNGQTVVALNGNRRHAFSPATSLLFFCGADDVERLIAKLAEGGERQPGGWLKDRYGVSWQIVGRG